MHQLFQHTNSSPFLIYFTKNLRIGLIIFFFRAVSLYFPTPLIGLVVLRFRWSPWLKTCCFMTLKIWARLNPKIEQDSFLFVLSEIIRYTLSRWEQSTKCFSITSCQQLTEQEMIVEKQQLCLLSSYASHCLPSILASVSENEPFISYG